MTPPDHTDTPEPWEIKAQDEADQSSEFRAVAYVVIGAVFFMALVIGAVVTTIAGLLP